MENINSAAELKLAIKAKELEHSIHGQQLKEQFYVTFESLKPLSIIKNTLQEITSSPYLIDNMMGALTGLVSGYVSKKIAVGTSHNIFRKVMGFVLQFGVTNAVAQHPDVIKTVGNFIIEKIRHRKDANTEKS